MQHKYLVKGCLVICLCAGLLSGCGTGAKGKDYEKGLSFVESEEFEDARGYFEQAVSTEDKLSKKEQKLNKKAFYGIGVTYFKEQDYKKANEYFTDALAISYLEDWDETILKYQVDTLCALGEYEQAYDIVTELRKEDKKNFDLFFQQYFILEAMDQTDEAQEFLNEGLEISGLGSAYKYNRAKIYYYLGNTKKAEESLNAALEKDIVEANLYLGKIAEDREDYETAVSLYETYLDGENSENGYALLCLAQTQEKMGQTDQALATYEQAIEHGDGSFLKELRFNQIVLLENTGDFNQAYKKCKSYVKEYEDDETMKREYRFLKTRTTKK